MWATHQHLHTPRAHRGGAVPTVSKVRVRLRWWSPTPHLTHPLTMGLLWQTRAPSCVHSWLWPRLNYSLFRLSICNRPQSSPWVCLLKHEFQHPAPACTIRCVSQAGECSEVARLSVLLSLHSACHNLAAALSSESLKLPVCPS